MGRVCTNAVIQTRPCAGTIFSREIKCKAGLPNTCLRNCNEKCPAYKVVECTRSSMPTREQTSSPQYGGSRAASQPIASRASAVPSVPRGPCSTCGTAKGS
jgi:hypothetical protein